MQHRNALALCASMLALAACVPNQAGQEDIAVRTFTADHVRKCELALEFTNTSQLNMYVRYENGLTCEASYTDRNTTLTLSRTRSHWLLGTPRHFTMSINADNTMIVSDDAGIRLAWTGGGTGDARIDTLGNAAVATRMALDNRFADAHPLRARYR